jgi:dTDP-4-amino-4,6-dideoxygalactose transaminase
MTGLSSSIPFSRPTRTGREKELILKALEDGELTEGALNQACRSWLESMLPATTAFLTPSCTAALEMAALLLNIGPGDEVIMPSFTFASAACAIALRGGVPVFVDIRPDTMNIDETLIEAAITPRTRAIMVMHYGGVACEMHTISAIAERHGLPVIEDAAQGIMASYHGKQLGTLGTIGTFSFHQTKNLSAGEGGALLLSDRAHIDRAQMLRHKGTNRVAFLQKTVSRYTWTDLGSSWVMNELCAAHLYGNLLDAKLITDQRLAHWQFYHNALAAPAAMHGYALPVIPEGCQHNAHIFYLKMRDIAQRTDFIAFMQEQGICTLFHYVPLHSSPAGKAYGRFHGEDRYTTQESEKLVRLPLFYGMTEGQAEQVVGAVLQYYAR